MAFNTLSVLEMYALRFTGAEGTTRKPSLKNALPYISKFQSHFVVVFGFNPSMI